MLSMYIHTKWIERAYVPSQKKNGEAWLRLIYTEGSFLTCEIHYFSLGNCTRIRTFRLYGARLAIVLFVLEIHSWSIFESVVFFLIEAKTFLSHL